MNNSLPCVETEYGLAELLIEDYSYFLEDRKNSFYCNNNLTINLWAVILASYNTLIQESQNNLITEFELLYEKQKTNYFPINELSDWYQLVVEDEKRHLKDGHRFNVFTLLSEKFGFYFYETMHSRLLKFFLDETEMHGQGTSFLMQFLNKLNVHSPELGKWSITAEVGRIDLLLERKSPQSIIVVENKSNWANDQENQIYRYWYRAIYSKTKQTDENFYVSNNDRYQIVYLAPKVSKEITEQSLKKPKKDGEFASPHLPEKVPIDIKTLTFDSFIQEWFDECIELLPENNHPVREFINQYKHHCKFL